MCALSSPALVDNAKTPMPGDLAPLDRALGRVWSSPSMQSTSLVQRMGLARCALAMVFALALSSEAYASHFRFGSISWTRVSGNTVEFTVRSAWRVNAVDAVNLNFGDGTSQCVYSAVGSVFGSCSGVAVPWTNEGTFTDLAGTGYTIVSARFQHTYANAGPFIAFFESCCRIGGLQNIGEDSFRVEACVDLRNGNTGTPSTSVPVILQMPITAPGVSFSVNLPIAEPDGDAINCRFSTGAESGAFVPPAQAGGNVLQLTGNGNCTLRWDTSGTSIGQRYQVALQVEENRAGNLCKSPLDFIIEIVGGINTPPTCSGSIPSQNVSVGSPFSATVTGDDIDMQALTTQIQGTVPAGMTFNPPIGTTQLPPFQVQIDWTPTAAQLGQTFAFNLIFQDTGGFQASCPFGLAVVDDPIFFNTPCGPGQVVMGSVGVPVTFPVNARANNGLPGEQVTLSSGALPMGASHNPPLPITGQPASTTFNWIPTNAQIGTHFVSYTAIDQLGQSVTCRVQIVIAECFLFLGEAPVNISAPFNSRVLVMPHFDYPVTMEDSPSFLIPNDPSLLGASIYAQIGMYNPEVFPNRPLQLTNGIEVILGSHTRNFGWGGSGMQIWLSDTPTLGNTVRFHFSIPGL